MDGAILAGITVILRFAKKEEKKLVSKYNSECLNNSAEARIMSAGKDVDEQEVIKKIFSRILEIEKEPNYIAPTPSRDI